MPSPQLVGRAKQTTGRPPDFTSAKVKTSSCDRRQEEEGNNRASNEGNKNVMILASSSSAILLVLLLALAAPASGQSARQLNSPPTSATNQDFQVVGQANRTASLPCLIGKQVFCGEPYFIAWYKLNATSRLWTRLEHQTANSEEAPADGHLSPRAPLNRIRFVWARDGQTSCAPASQQVQPDGSVASAPPLAVARLGNGLFDCGQLRIGPLELADEGQYKCETTFSDSLDFDKCPASTSSKLSVTGKSPLQSDV